MTQTKHWGIFFSVSITTENYLKKIYELTESTRTDLVGLGDLAQGLGVTPGTVTTMMKNLAGAGLVDYQPRIGVTLTKHGLQESLGVLRRHRLLELFLVEILDLDWAEVHEEAEELEHAISDRLLNRIDEVLGHPTVDPHGDPIPNAAGDIVYDRGPLLSELKPPAEIRIDQVEHEDAEFLIYLKETGLVPGVQAYLLDRNQVAGTITVKTDSITTLSIATARKIRVRPI